jgi:hypothetical protein
MFEFFRRAFRQQREAYKQSLTAPLLAECEKEVKRTAAMNPYFASQRDVTLRTSLLQKAAHAGISDHETVKRLAFLNRLIEAITVDPTPPDEVLVSLVEEATRYGFDDITAVRNVKDHLELAQLKREGPHVVGHDSQGRAIYFKCTAEFKNREGRFEIRGDGVSFTGEVFIEILWSDIVHASRTTHSYKDDTYKAVSFQERKRCSATKFAFPLSRECEYACEVTMLSWEAHQRRTAEPETSKDSPQEVRRSTTDIDPAEHSPRDASVGTTIEFPRERRFWCRGCG